MDLRSLTEEELALYLNGDKEEDQNDDWSFKEMLSGLGDLAKSAVAAGVNRVGTTYDWAVNNNPSGVGYSFDYNTALQLQDQKNELEKMDTSNFNTQQLAAYYQQMEAIKSNYKALLTDPNAYDEGQMDQFLNRYRESMGYNLLKSLPKPETKTREQVLEKLYLEEMRSNIYKHLDFKDHTVTKSDGTQLKYSAHDLPIIMDTVIENHKRTFEGAIKALAFYENLSDPTSKDEEVKEEAKKHIDNITRYMTDYINNLEESTSLGSALYAAKWAEDGDSPFTVKNGLGLESNNELYFERQMNRRRLEKTPYNPFEIIEAASNILYEVGDNAMSLSKLIFTSAYMGVDKAERYTKFSHDSAQVSNTEISLKKEQSFFNSMGNFIQDAGPDIAAFLLVNKGVGKLASIAEGALSVEKLSNAFNVASKIIRTSKKLQLDKIDEAIVGLEAVTPAAKAFSTITSFLVRETIENVGAQLALSGGTMENYNSTDLALDIGFSLVFGGMGVFTRLKGTRAFLEQDKAMMRSLMAQKVFNISDELWHQIDDQTKLSVGDAMLSLMKHDTISPNLNAIISKAKLVYENVDEFVDQVKKVAETRMNQVFEYGLSLNKYKNIIEQLPDGTYRLSKDAPKDAYLNLNSEYLNHLFLKEQGKKSAFAAGMSAFALNKEKSLVERIQNAREAYKNFRSEEWLEKAEARKASVENNQIMHALFERWIEKSGKKYPETIHEWTDTLDEFMLEAGRVQKEFFAEGSHLNKKADEAVENQIVDKTKRYNANWIAEAYENVNRNSNASKHATLTYLSQGYEFAQKFLPDLRNNGEAFFNAVMKSSINDAAKVAVLGPAGPKLDRVLNEIFFEVEQGKFSGGRMFRNPAEVAYFLGDSGTIKIGDQSFSYKTNYHNDTIDLDSLRIPLYGKEIKFELEGFAQEGSVKISFEKNARKTIKEVFDINNSFYSLIASKVDYAQAKNINPEITISEQTYNRIMNQNISYSGKTKILDELVNDPPKFSAASTYKPKDGNYYMQYGDYGFKHIETMRMFRGDKPLISLRDMDGGADYARPKEYHGEFEKESGNYILYQEGSKTPVGFANPQEIVINDQTFKGDVLIHNESTKLENFKNNLDALVALTKDEDIEKAITIFKDLGYGTLPRSGAEIKNKVILALNTAYKGGLPEIKRFETAASLIKQDEFTLNLLSELYTKYGYNEVNIYHASEEFLKNREDIIGNIVGTKMKYLVDALDDYLKKTIPDNVPKVIPPTAEDIVDITDALNGVVPGSFFKEGGPFYNNIEHVKQSLEEGTLQKVLKGSEEQYDEFIKEIEADYDKYLKEEYESLRSGPTSYEADLIKEEYEQTLEQANGFKEKYYPPENDADKITEQLKDNATPEDVIPPEVIKYEQEVLSSQSDIRREFKMREGSTLKEALRDYTQYVYKEIQATENYVDDILTVDYTPAAAKAKGIDASWYRNKEVYNPNKHVAFLDEDVQLPVGIYDKNKTTLRELINNVAGAFGSYDRPMVLIDKVLDMPMGEIENLKGDKRLDTWRDLKRGFLDFMRVSIEAVLKTDVDITKVALWLPDNVATRNELLDFYMKVRGPMDKEIFNPENTTPIFGTYFYGHGTNLLGYHLGEKNIDNLKSGSYRTKVFGDLYFLNKYKGDNIPEALSGLWSAVRAISTLYENLPLNVKTNFVRQDRKLLKEINDNIWNDNVARLNPQAIPIKNKLKQIIGYTYHINEELVSKEVYDMILNLTKEPFFNVADTLTNEHLIRVGSNGSIIGALVREMNNVTGFSAINPIETFPKDKDFVFVQDITNHNQFIANMDKLGYEMLVLKKFDGQLLASFGTLFRKKVPVQDIDMVNIIHDNLKKMPEPDYQKGIDTSAFSDNAVLVEPPSVFPDAEKISSFKDFDKYSSTPDAKHLVSEQQLQGERRVALKSIHPDNPDALLKFVNDYSPIYTDEKGYIKTITSPVPWYNKYSNLYLDMMLHYSEDTRLLLMPSGLPSNGITTADNKDLFDIFYTNILKEESGKAITYGEIKKRVNVLIDSLITDGNPYAVELKKELENVPILKSQNYLDLFFPGRDSKAVLDAINKFTELNNTVSYVIDPHNLKDEMFKNAVFSEPDAIILSTKPDTYEAYKNLHDEMSRRGYIPIIKNNIVGEMMQRNGIYWEKAPKVKEAIAKEQTEKAKEIIDGIDFIRTPCE